MKPIYGILAGAAIPSAFILAWMLLDTTCTPNAAEIAGESVRECYRAWIGSLSGWAAAIVGGITVAVLFFQIRKTEETANRQQTEAREAFDDAFAETLNLVNEIWKHSEDIIQNCKDDPRIDEYVRHMKVRLNAVRTSIDDNLLKSLCGQMHPIDAYKRAKLIDRVIEATKPVTLPVVDQKRDRIHKLEVTGVHYFEILVVHLLIATHRIDRVSEEFSSIFANRESKSRDEVMASEKDDFRKFYFQEFPSNHSNPY